MKKEITFEKALARLAEINGKLESDEISLDESVELFKEGLELSKFCQKKLDDAKLEIEKIDI
ncbi:MAG: exodeoxyribonuclease VII small subunit [Oscillospiraceae bacterium]|nr:exodeoxyribonuclease VII small subunit [Oscillospiraceae bacterium]MBR3610697.1 exodeoxyribonuclease VII small subunit [Oscillospiraceae bacterium]MBR3953102.1 exodeoxyribonuclease VII small subunit [Oscillospiraceae bacterium]